MTYHPSEVRLRRLLGLLVPVFFGAAFLYLLAPFPGLGPLRNPMAEMARELPFVSNSVVKVSLIMLCCMFAAGDVRRRRGLVGIVALAHVVSIAAMLLLLILGRATGDVLVGNSFVPVRTLLWGAIALDGVILVIVAGFYFSTARHQPSTRNSDEAGPLTPAENRLRVILYLLAAAFVVAIAIYEGGAILPATQGLFRELPFVTNSVVKVATLAMLCLYAARNLRRNMPVAGIVIAAHFISIIAMGLFFLLVPDRTRELVTLWNGQSVPMWQLLLGAIVLDGVITIVLLVPYLAAWRARYSLVFLQPMEYRALVSLADVLIKANEEALPPLEIAWNLEEYVRQITVKRRWVYRAALFGAEYHSLIYLKAPLSELDEIQREHHLRVHFERNVLLPIGPEWWRRLVQAIIRVGKQLVYVGYYSDHRTFKPVGYRPFSQRELEAGRPLPPKAQVKLDVLDATTIAEDDPRLAGYDVCIIGSGAGGSVMAYRLVERGKKVLLVERGEYMTPDRFSENEVEMIKHLYADGVFQQTEDFRFTILQGSCVGGSTVVNNAVCFEPPSRVLDAWNDPAIHDAGLSRTGIANSITRVRSLIGVERQPAPFLNPSGARIAAAAAAESPDLTVNTVEANVHDCRGCGYCNIGCAYGKKLSMLDRVLPEAQRKFPGKLTILSNAPVTRLLNDGRRPARILGARVTVAGPRRDRKLTLRAEKYIVSAGTVASSYLLMRSGIGRDLPVGRQMSFNMGSPVTADFPENVESFGGLQISHFMAPPEQRGFVAETWFNPPVAQALNMPGWFEDHFHNMRRYSHMGAVGILVGTENTAYLRQAITGGPGVTYTPSARDLYKLADGMAQMAGVMFKAGAERVLLNTWRYDVLTHPNQVGNIYRIAEDPRNLTLGTGHPQGGNGLSRDPGRGVIDEQFRVHGTTNLHVCDASVFPSSLTVNPQFTVMTLADYAAPMI